MAAGGRPSTSTRPLLGAVKRGQVAGKWSLLVDGLTVPAGLEKAVEAFDTFKRTPKFW